MDVYNDNVLLLSSIDTDMNIVRSLVREWKHTHDITNPSSRRWADCIGLRLIALEIQQNCSACNKLYLLHQIIIKMLLAQLVDFHFKQRIYGEREA